MIYTHSTLSKKAKTVAWLHHHASFRLQCIHCKQRLHVKDNHLVCDKGHQFDMNKQGFYFMAHRSVDAKYDRELFEARRQIICETKFYDKLHQQLFQLLNHYDRPLTIVDAGCGEGSHLAMLSRLLNKTPTAIALDLSKPGIQQASDYAGEMLPVVADLANLPIANQQVDVLLSLLSPANYEEFKRVLKIGGALIKVIPNLDYLKEIRCLVSESESYSNETTASVFRKHFGQVEEIRVKDHVYFTLEERRALMQMTPLTWDLSESKRQALLMELPEYITLDLTILHAKKIKSKP